MTAIVDVDAWEVLDSRGDPTVAARVRLAGGAVGECAVPAGASTSRHEARELRDGGERYGGRGARRAAENARTVLAAAVHGRDASDQRGVDTALREADGTADLGRLGANSVLAVSVATALAAANAHDVPLYEWVSGSPVLPLPMVNILSGGAHAARCLDIQDVLVIPTGAGTFAEAIEWAGRVRRAAMALATDRGMPASLVADEGGLGLPLPRNEEALALVTAAIERAGLAPGGDVALAVDLAASQFRDGGRYAFRIEDRLLDPAALVDELAGWTQRYPLVSLEDPCDEDDWETWRGLTKRLGSRVQLIGDDLFATNARRLDRGIHDGVANAVLVKPNQAGTLTSAADVLAAAKAHGYATVVSARSGETEDSWIADLAVGWGARQIKVGSTTRSERMAKWNRLLGIEHTMPELDYAGRGALAAG